jgi:hypothetical protein
MICHHLQIRLSMNMAVGLERLRNAALGQDSFFTRQLTRKNVVLYSFVFRILYQSGK